MAAEGGRGGEKRYDSQPMEGASKDSSYFDDVGQRLSWSTVSMERHLPQSLQPMLSHYLFNPTPTPTEK